MNWLWKSALLLLVPLLILTISLPSTPVVAMTGPLAEWWAPTNYGTTSITLNGELIILGDAPQVWGYFEYGTTTAYGNIFQTSPLLGLGAYSANITGLAPNTIYHYRVGVIATQGWQGSFSPDKTFKTLPTSVTPPSVTTLAATSVSGSSARLNGNLASLGGAATVNAAFEWGYSPGYVYVTSNIPMTAPGDFFYGLSGLDPLQDHYHYRARADGGTCGIVFGVDNTFSSRQAPTVVTGTAEPYTTGANLQGTLTSLGSASTVSVSFDYGATTSYGSTTTPRAKTSTGAFTEVVGSLTADTLYHFRAKADGGTAGVANGPDAQFRTDTFTFDAICPRDWATGSKNTFYIQVDLKSGASRMCRLSSADVPAGASLTFTRTEGMPPFYTFVQFNAGTCAPGSYTPNVICSWGNASKILPLPVEVHDLTKPGVTTVRVDMGGWSSEYRVEFRGRLYNPTSNNLSCSFEWGSGLTRIPGVGYQTVAQSVREGEFRHNEDISREVLLSRNNVFHVRARADAGALGVFYGEDIVFRWVGADVTVNDGNSIGMAPGSTKENIPVTIKASRLGGTEVALFNFNLTWNKDIIQLDNLAPATISGWTMTFGIPDNSTGRVRLMGSTISNPIRGDVVIGTFRIRAVGAAGALSMIDPLLFDMTDLEGINVDTSRVGTAVSITDRTVDVSLRQSIGPGSVVEINLFINRVKDGSGNAASVPEGVSGCNARYQCSPAASFLMCMPDTAIGLGAQCTLGGANTVRVRQYLPGTTPLTDTLLQGGRLILNGSATESCTLNVSLDLCTGPGEWGSGGNVMSSGGGATIGKPGANMTKTGVKADGITVHVIPAERPASLTFQRGDVKADGVVNVFDAMYIAQCIVGLRPWSDINLANAACVKHDGLAGDKIDIFDAMYIAQYVVGLRNNRFE